MKIYFGLFFLFLLCFQAVSSGRASPFSSSDQQIEYRSTSFPSSYTYGNRKLDVVGTSLLKYKRLFKLYTGALYLDADESGELASRAKRFEVVYLRKLNGMDLVNAGSQNLTAKLDREKLARLNSRLDQMNVWWQREFFPGDRAAISYIPGKGTALEINDELQGWIVGEDFASVYFSIWLGPGEVSSDFRSGLLAKSP